MARRKYTHQDKTVRKGKATRRIRKFLKKLWTDKNAISSVEYALLLAAIAGPIALAAVILSNSLTVVLNDAADCVVVGCV